MYIKPQVKYSVSLVFFGVHFGILIYSPFCYFGFIATLELKYINLF